jgi:SAM-dependent methyltransferase
MQTHDSGEDSLRYVGNELELFEAARNWKRYFSSRIRPFIRGDVLEVGAGLGVNTPYLCNEAVASWSALEPDARLCDELSARLATIDQPVESKAIRGTLAALPPESRFDAILYIDVLEHIEDDRGEFAQAFARLKPGGALCILCPAHQRFFSPFDAALGHYRRYDKPMFRGLSSHQPHRLEYLDTVGMAASLANCLMLRQSYPTAGQIALWDRCMVPLSRIVDRLTFGTMGKSVLGVWLHSRGD